MTSCIVFRPKFSSIEASNILYFSSCSPHIISILFFLSFANLPNKTVARESFACRKRLNGRREERGQWWESEWWGEILQRRKKKLRMKMTCKSLTGAGDGNQSEKREMRGREKNMWTRKKSWVSCVCCVFVCMRCDAYVLHHLLEAAPVNELRHKIPRRVIFLKTSHYFPLLSLLLILSIFHPFGCWCIKRKFISIWIHVRDLMMEDKATGWVFFSFFSHFGGRRCICDILALTKSFFLLLTVKWSTRKTDSGGRRVKMVSSWKASTSHPLLSDPPAGMIWFMMAQANVWQPLCVPIRYFLASMNQTVMRKDHVCLLPGVRCSGSCSSKDSQN